MSLQPAFRPSRQTTERDSEEANTTKTKLEKFSYHMKFGMNRMLEKFE